MSKNIPPNTVDKEPKVGDLGVIRFHVTRRVKNTEVKHERMSPQGFPSGIIVPIQPQEEVRYEACGKFFGTHYSPDAIGQVMSADSLEELMNAIYEEMKKKPGTYQPIFDIIPEQSELTYKGALSSVEQSYVRKEMNADRTIRGSAIDVIKKLRALLQ